MFVRAPAAEHGHNNFTNGPRYKFTPVLFADGRRCICTGREVNIHGHRGKNRLSPVSESRHVYAGAMTTCYRPDTCFQLDLLFARSALPLIPSLFSLEQDWILRNVDVKSIRSMHGESRHPSHSSHMKILVRQYELSSTTMNAVVMVRM